MMNNEDKRDTNEKGSSGGETPAIILSLIIAFLGIVFLSFFAHWYEVVIMESAHPSQVIVNALPPIVLFMMAIAVLGLNPLLRLISRSLTLGSRELFMIVTLWLAASVICFANGMMPFLMTIGTVNSSLEEHPLVTRVGFRDHLNQRLFLPAPAADEYYLGKSRDGRTRVPPVAGSPLFRAGDFRNIGAFAMRVRQGDDPLSRYLRHNISPEALESLQHLAEATAVFSDKLIDELNALIDGPLIYDEDAFARVPLTQRVRERMEIAEEREDIRRLNRGLLESAFPSYLTAVREGEAVDFHIDQIRDIQAFAAVIRDARDGVEKLARDRMSAESARALEEYLASVDTAIPLQVAELNRLVMGPLLLGENGLRGLSLSGSSAALVNRSLLEASYPDEIRPSAMPVSWPFQMDDLADPAGLAVRIERGGDPLSIYLRGRLSEETLSLAARAPEGFSDEETVQFINGLRASLNGVVSGELIYTPERFPALELDESLVMLLNRITLEEGYSRELVSFASAVPWRLWMSRFVFWGPFMALSIIFSISLVRMMHRQWSQHELITYPLATVIDSYLRRDQGGLLPDVFRSKIFWIGFIGIFILYTINGLNLYFPLMIRIPTLFSHIDLLREFDFLARYSGREAYSLLRGFIYPFVIAIMVLLPTDISLTSWLGWVLMVFGTGFYFIITGDSISEPDFDAMRVAMYFALGLVIILIGRREYANIVRHALTFRKSPDAVMNRAAWACRVFLLSFAGMVGMFMIAGLNWFMSILVVASFGLVVLLIARLTAETGIPWLSNMRALSAHLPLRILGAAAIGPQALAVMSVMTWPLDVDTTNTFPAQETTYIKNREKYCGGWLTHTRFNLILALGIMVAMAASGFFHLWNNYTFGSRREQVMFYRTSYGMRDTAREIERLRIEGVYEASAQATTLGRLRNFRFDQRFWSFFALGAGLVMVCSLMRLRFTWWPFHPLPLLFINTWAMSRLYTSIFMGWVIKTALLRIWGGKTFAGMKPFFVGVIVGQAAILCVWILVGAIYFLVRDIAPPRLNYMWL